MLYIHNVVNERLIGNYQDWSPWRKNTTVINGVWSPTRITQVWNVDDKTTIVITSNKAVKTARAITSVCQRTTCQTFLIIEELRQCDGHTKHRDTSTAPHQKTLADILLVVGNGIVDDKCAYNADDTGLHIAESLNIRGVTVNGISGCGDSICDSIRIDGACQEHR